ncbi:MAG TPA: hypothetical protein VE078_01420 [Thermoanaerobaculia bacterium]|nr:hypothetical protein [Thermoanaerobaculia bacterium]
MQTSSESYKGTWQVTKWIPLIPALPEWLVQTGSRAMVTITEGGEQNGKETWVLEWNDKHGRKCTVSGLTQANDVLNVGQVNIEIEGLPPITTSGAVVGRAPTAETGIRKIVVGLAPIRDFGDDEPGTFTAQNPPGEPPLRLRWVRWLRSLFHLSP